MSSIKKSEYDNDNELILDTAITSHEIKEVEELTNELKRLLVRHESTLSNEGIRREVEILERWMESYRRGLAAADKISGKGMEWLSNLRDHLRLAANEMIRLEGEGGNPGSKEQEQKTQDLINAADRIDKVIPDIKHIFHAEEENENA